MIGFHLQSTGSKIIDIAVIVLNVVVWVIVGAYKFIVAEILGGISLVFPNIPFMALVELNEILHTVALLVAITGSVTTIFFLIRKNKKK